MIDQRLPMAELPAAYARMGSRQVQGKVVMINWRSSRPKPAPVGQERRSHTLRAASAPTGEFAAWGLR